MSIAKSIVATYRSPRSVYEHWLSEGQREDRFLAWLMAACALMFVAQLPRLSREAHIEGKELDMLMGGALLGWVIIAPLFFYALAWASRLIARMFGGQGTFWTARLSLFWALLAAAPIYLLLGLLLGFAGQGAQSTLIGALWATALFWFWGTGLWQSERRVAA